MRRDRVAGALLALVGSVLLAVPALADDPTEAPTAGPAAIDGVALRWGVNNESSNRAFAPRTYNFFSAGQVPDPGKGGTTLPRSGWHQKSGDVAIEKWNGSAWKPATWAGLSTDSSGAELGSPTAGTFSNHRFVFAEGVGTVDLAAGTAHVAWDGDVTVLYYSGMSFFTISDPVLDVADGRGTLTATVSGYASSVDNPDSWAPVAAAQVTLADLPEVEPRRGRARPRPRRTSASPSPARARSRVARAPARSRRRSSTTCSGWVRRRSGCPAARRPTRSRCRCR